MIEEWQMRGTVVLVRPDLEYDPLGKQNQVGVICEANLNYDDIYVDFVDKTGLYPADALFTFLSQDEILANLTQLPAETDAETFKALCKVEAFLGYNDVNWKFKAMQIARDHPAVQPLCVSLLKSQITRNIGSQYGRD
ncbi:MAG: hypothetical protein M3O71_21195 [Bacteroidota bacterium]|nr:hypothetical protein [Bacteroidota bacterium]